MAKPLLITMAGASGSGKTTILKSLMSHLPSGTVSILTQDDYYLARHLQKADENGVLNFDRPESIDRSRLASDLNALMTGNSVTISKYAFNNPQTPFEMATIHPAPLLIVEGLFVFHFSELDNLSACRVFIYADETECLSRRINRDGAERGYTEEDVRYRWQKHVMPAYRNFLLPHRERCDFEIDNTYHFGPGLKALVEHLSGIVGHPPINTGGAQ